MIKQEKLYLIITNKNNEKCLFLTPQTISKLLPIKPEILYDGGEHAILYRNTQETIILDYLPSSQREDLKTLSEILTVEYDVNTKTIVNEYISKVTIVNKIPDISNDLEIKK
ncbi:MAG: hypothetical protein IKP65_05055 [Alphaproteobacteria bacterium]|nr:hypothetical protein [Alphaproteobacteria bacterium]MBR4316313.1 hypothetical protein [Alphaproteobacteria bacterium]